VSRRSILAAVAAVAVVAGVGGWMVGRQIESPAEAAARLAPPPASLISVPVELQELSSAVVTRGTIEFDQATGIDVTGSDLGSTIITRLTKADGDQLVEGDVAIEVAGRPLFVLEGELPVFRSFAPGLDGPDVLQLEQALARLGFDPGPVDGIYGSRTEAAIEAMYRDAGYRPPVLDVSDQATLEAARDRVAATEDAVASARRTASASGLPTSERLELDRSIDQAQGNLDALIEERDAALAELSQTRDRAISARDEAQGTFVSFKARENQAEAGTHPDTGLPPTPAELDILSTQRRGARIARNAARADLNAANAALETGTAVWAPRVTNAEIDVAIARARRSEAIQQAATAGSENMLNQAQSELADAEEDLVALEREIGTRLPAAELVFLLQLPRLVQEITVDVGDFSEGPVMFVTSDELAVVSTVSVADRALLELGMAGFLDDPNQGITVPVQIQFIADIPGGPDISSDRYRLRLVPTGEVPEEVFNQNLRLSIPISSTGGEVLTVPLAALSAAADGTSRVEMLVSGNETKLIEVRVGLSSRGFVEVEALDNALQPGDRVVVARDLPAGSGNEDENVDTGPADGDGE